MLNNYDLMCNQVIRVAISRKGQCPVGFVHFASRSVSASLKSGDCSYQINALVHSLNNLGDCHNKTILSIAGAGQCYKRNGW